MKTILNIVTKEFLQIRRDRRMLFLALAAPVVQLLLLGYAATTDIRSIPFLVCDEDHSSSSRELVSRFVNSGYFTLEKEVSSAKEIDEHIESGNVWIALVIPARFSEDVLAHKTSTLQIIADGSDANSASVGVGYASQIIATYSQSIAADVIARTPGLKLPARILPEVRVWYNPELKSRNFMIPGVVALVLMMVTMTLTSLAIVKEKEAGTLEQLLVSPIKPYQLVIGKLLPFVVIGAIDVSLVLVAARFWFDIPIRGSVTLLYGLAALFVMTSLGLGLFVSTISKTQQQAMMTAQFFILIPFNFLSGFTFPIENMPRIIQYITYIIPLRYFITIIRGIFLKGNGFADLWGEALALTAFGVVTLTLAVWRFHKRLG